MLERRLAGRIGVLQHGCIDVDDHLVALTRRARIHRVMKRRLGDQAQRVRLLLGHGRRLHRHVGRKRFRGNVFRFSIQRLARRGQRLNQHGTGLAVQPPADDHHAVFILIHVQGAARVAFGGLGGFGVAVNPAPSADDALDVLGGAGATDTEQPFFGLRRRHAGQRPYLGV